MIQELKDVSTGWNKGLLSTKERDLKISLIIGQVEKLQVNFLPLAAATDDTRGVFNQLLNSRKYTAIDCLEGLKKAGDNKRKYNVAARMLIAKKLYFPPLALTIKRSTEAYQFKGGSVIDLKKYQMFIYENKEMESAE